MDKERKEILIEHTLTIRALVRTKDEDQFIFLPSNSSTKTSAIVSAIETQFIRKSDMSGLKLITLKNPSTEKFAALEDTFLPKGYRIGVLYCGEGQTTENDIYGNTGSSLAYEEFLDFLGKRIELKGWEGFRGGLDTNENSTGTHSIVTDIDGFNVMFHVATMLPYCTNDPQQLERKRHIGNDICTIVFKETPESFSPTIFTSEIMNVFCVVTRDYSNRDSQTRYRVSFAYKGNMGFSTPRLPSPPIFELNQVFRNLMLRKLINAERLALRGSEFVSLLSKTKEKQMEELIKSVK